MGASMGSSPAYLSGRSWAKAILLLIFLWVLAGLIRSDNQYVPAGQRAADLVKAGLRKSGIKIQKDAESALLDIYPAVQHTDRAAVIIENRPLENLIPVILHFHSVLGPEWPIIFYTLPTTADALSLSPPFARAVDEGRVEVRFIPPEIVFDSHRAVSLFLADSWLWEDLAPYKKVLLFQDDSIICSAFPGQVDDFLEYDLIGAPIAPNFGMGFNGGLSIRNRELTLEIVRRYSWANDSVLPNTEGMAFEDQWLFTRMKGLPARKDGSPGARLPNTTIAMKFAVETMWEEKPMGFHQPLRWQKGNIEKIMQYCPEVGMISGSAFFG